MAAAKMILTAEKNSGKFSDRVLVLGEGEQVGVGRSTRELRPDTENAVFDSRVLSKHQATLIFNRGQFLLRDSGSSNGSFINNFRLSKPGEESLATQIYSKDIIRFGSQVNDKNKKVKEKCIVARVQLFLPGGQEVKERPPTDRLFRPKEELVPVKDKSPNKQVSFNQDNLIENKVDKLEKILTERLGADQDVLEQKLKEKEAETETLEAKVRYSKECEEKLAAQLEEQKAEAMRLADKLAEQAKEQMDGVKVTDLQAELEDTKTALKRMTEETWLAKERLRVEMENKQKRERELTESCNLAAKQELIQLQKELDRTKLEVKQLNELVSEADEIVKDKEREIVTLTELVDRDKMLIQERDGEYQDLQCLMTEENETVHQIESEMKRLLNIIAEDQETILQKDKQVISLQKALKAKDDFLRKETNEISDTKHDIENMFQQTLAEKNEEINELEKEMQGIINEKESEIFELKVTLEAQKKISNESNNLDDANREMELLITTNEALKTKMEDLMRIVEKKNQELEQARDEMKNEGEQKTVDIEKIKQELTENLDAREKALQENIEKIKGDFHIQEQLEATNESLQKEILVMKVQNQQKDLDIKCLQEMADSKDENLRENAATINDYEAEISRLKIEVETSKASEAEAVNNNDETAEKDQTIKQLQQKIIDEQEANKQVEEELIQLKIDFDNFKQTKEDEPKPEDNINDDEKTNLIKLKDLEIASLQQAIRQEQDIVAHVQLTQEKEIIDKEREIAVLNAILLQERQTILAREAEISSLLGRGQTKENGLSPLPPTRTKRNKGPVLAPNSPPVRMQAHSLATVLQSAVPQPLSPAPHHQETLARMLQAASPTDDESTMTFHDALSDDEDVLIEDLEIDAEEDDRQHRRSDLVDLDPE